MIKERQISLHMNGRCLKDDFHEPSPFEETVETGIEDLLLFFLYTYQPIRIGNKINKAKNHGWPKIILLK
jgi:hypothetical protein